MQHMMGLCDNTYFVKEKSRKIVSLFLVYFFLSSFISGKLNFFFILYYKCQNKIDDDLFSFFFCCIRIFVFSSVTLIKTKKENKDARDKTKKITMLITFFLTERLVIFHWRRRAMKKSYVQILTLHYHE